MSSRVVSVRLNNNDARERQALSILRRFEEGGMTRRAIICQALLALDGHAIEDETALPDSIIDTLSEMMTYQGDRIINTLSGATFAGEGVSRPVEEVGGELSPGGELSQHEMDIADSIRLMMFRDI